MTEIDKRAEYRRKWADALRSGNYKQTDGQLRRGDRFCCLGVLCDLVKEEVGGKWEKDHFLVGGNQYGDLVPLEVQDVVRLESADGSYCGETLAALNDSGLSFEEIADIIEGEPFGLFDGVQL